MDELRYRLRGQSRQLLRRKRDEFLQLQRGCTVARLNRALVRERQWLTHTSATVSMLDPMKTLRRGFSILRNSQGTIVSTIGDITIGEPLETQVSDGIIASRVHQIVPQTQE